MEKKQTAFEWYIEQKHIIDNKLVDGILSCSGFESEVAKLKIQAKQMEKEQMIDAILDNRNITSQVTLKDAEQYYNETYGNGGYK
jgi:hypothetical protein